MIETRLTRLLGIAHPIVCGAVHPGVVTIVGYEGEKVRELVQRTVAEAEACGEQLSCLIRPTPEVRD